MDVMALKGDKSKCAEREVKVVGLSLEGHCLAAMILECAQYWAKVCHRPSTILQGKPVIELLEQSFHVSGKMLARTGKLDARKDPTSCNHACKPRSFFEVAKLQGKHGKGHY